MYIPLEFIELTELIEECNELRNALKKIKDLSGETDGSNFENQSKEIASVCENALKNKLPILSKEKSELLESWEYHIESIISGEFNEQFQR